MGLSVDDLGRVNNFLHFNSRISALSGVWDGEQGCTMCVPPTASPLLHNHSPTLCKNARAFSHSKRPPVRAQCTT